MNRFVGKDQKTEAKSHTSSKSIAKPDSSVKSLQALADSSEQVNSIAQLKSKANENQPIQRQENNTGLPDQLKSGIENLSGYSMDDVKVHYNSSKPAQLNAHAYAQGTDIHLASGQERDLPHEAWHVVQQKQGRVKPTMQMKDKVNINDDDGLEKEADVMGAKALNVSEKDPLQRKNDNTTSPNGVVQRAVGFEFECNWDVHRVGLLGGLNEYPKKTLLHQGNGWTMETDGSDIEFVVNHVQEGERDLLAERMGNLNGFVTDMNGQRANEPIRNPNFVTARRFYQTTEVDTDNQNILANPQATGGIRLERIESLYRSLSRDGEDIPEATNVLGGQAPNFYATKAAGSVNAIEAVKALNLIPEQDVSDRLAGVVGIICQYLDFGSGNLPLQTAKYMTWIMARTDFGAMLTSTPEIAYLREHQNEWIDLVLNTAMGAFHEALDANAPVIERPITDAGNLAGDQRIQIPITRRQWLLGMLNGVDLLTKHAQQVHWYSWPAHRRTYKDTRANLGHRLRGLGGLRGATDDTLADQRAEILEFRSIRRAVPFANWGPLALRVFDFITAINAAEHADDRVEMDGP